MSNHYAPIFIEFAEQHPTRRQNYLLSRCETPVSQRLNVYTQTISGTFHRVLRDAYPACSHILGPKRWKQLFQYRKACADESLLAFQASPTDPPNKQSYNSLWSTENTDLNVFGALFIDILESALDEKIGLTESERWQSPFDDILTLAKLEWQLHLAQHVSDDSVATPSDFKKLSNTPAHLLHFVASHALSLHRSIYPLDMIIQKKMVLPVLENGPHNYCVYRQTPFHTRVRLLTNLEASILGYIFEKKHLQIFLKALM